MSVKFSVIIPLYNKESEIGRALRSVSAQILPPFEIVVVDDGSTDRSVAAVEKIISETQASEIPSLKLIRQQNAGVSAARDRGMAEAAGDHFALLDADDEWRPEFLETVATLISEFPEAGIYCTGFDIDKGGRQTPARTPARRGVVGDFFGESMRGFVATASTSVLPRAVVDEVGGFPPGMSLGEDQYMWTKIALRYPVVFTPERLAVIHASAANRSAAIYTPEKTSHSFRDFLTDPVAGPLLKDYIARVELGKAITATVRGATEEGRRAERDFAYGRRGAGGRLWWRLWLLNRLPATWRPSLNALYAGLAWKLAKRGV